jgi:hypothetical protein
LYTVTHLEVLFHHRAAAELACDSFVLAVFLNVIARNGEQAAVLPALDLREAAVLVDMILHFCSSQLSVAAQLPIRTVDYQLVQ